MFYSAMLRKEDVHNIDLSYFINFYILISELKGFIFEKTDINFGINFETVAEA